MSILDNLLVKLPFKNLNTDWVLHRFADENGMYLAAAEYFTNIAAEAIRARGRFVVALSGGGTPQKFFQFLSKQPFNLRADQSKFFVFFSDERMVDPESNESNAGNAMRNWLNHSDVPREQVFVPDTNSDATVAASGYENEIRTLMNDDPQFDLIMLGMGDDGHTASIFPGSAVLEENRKLLSSVMQVPRVAPQFSRITFTPLLINAAAHRMFLVNGKSKAALVKKVHEPGTNPSVFPAALFAQNSDWFVCI